MPIFLVRHGETPLNAARVLQPFDTPLSDIGLAQAQLLGKRLSEQHFDAVLSSDMPRALQTAQAILAAQSAPAQRTQTISTSTLLQERNLGDYRGKSYDLIGKDILSLEEAPPNGESLAEFEARVDEGFDYFVTLHQQFVTKANPDPYLLVVSHGLVIRHVIAARLKLPAGLKAPAHIANTAVTIFSADAPHEASSVNSASHLAAELLPRNAQLQA